MTPQQLHHIYELKIQNIDKKIMLTRKDNNYNSTDNYKAAYQNPPHFKDLENLKRQRT